MQLPAVALGVLIGLVSGLAFMLLLRTALSGKLEFKASMAIVGELLAIPTFWFGGSWVTASLLQGLNVAEILPTYMVALAVVFSAIAIYPLSRLVIRLGNGIGAMEMKPDA